MGKTAFHRSPGIEPTGRQNVETLPEVTVTDSSSLWGIMRRTYHASIVKQRDKDDATGVSKET